MPAQKKRKLKKPKQVNKSKEFTWSTKRKEAALLLSTGLKTQKEVCEEIHITEKTMCEWKKFPAFLEKIDELTIKNENFTRAGLLKECLKGLSIKTDHICEDRSTHLDYVKLIADLQGHTKQKVELDANLKHSNEQDPEEMTDEELRQSIRDDITKLITAGYVQTRTTKDISASEEN